MAEVIVAIGVLATMLVAILLLFTQLMASTTKNNLVNLGSLYADRIIEQALSTAVPSVSGTPAFPGVRTGEESVVSHGEERSTTFAYRVEATQLTPTTNPGEQWLLEVEVQWWHDNPNDPSKSRVGYGKLSTKQRRIVYVK